MPQISAPPAQAPTASAVVRAAAAIYNLLSWIYFPATSQLLLISVCPIRALKPVQRDGSRQGPCLNEGEKTVLVGAVVLRTLVACRYRLAGYYS